MRRYIIIALIILLAGATYLTGFFIKKERSSDENLSLKQENENLKTEIQKSQLSSVIDVVFGESHLVAKIFSTYPFNTKNKITINIGEKQGIKKMMVATVGENILLGQITEVSENSSVVQTIFDPNWQLPVRIGEGQVDGLFQGGNTPKVVLIEKNKPVKTGDMVYSAGQEFPYGLKIGEITDIKDTAAGVFKEAFLKMPFNVGELREVQIIIK